MRLGTTPGPDPARHRRLTRRLGRLAAVVATGGLAACASPVTAPAGSPESTPSPAPAITTPVQPARAAFATTDDLVPIWVVGGADLVATFVNPGTADDDGLIEVFDADGTAVRSFVESNGFSGDCGAAILDQDGRSVLLTPANVDLPCGLGGVPSSDIPGHLLVTDDGRWGRYAEPAADVLLLDLRSGSVRPAPDSVSVIGNWLVQGTPTGIADEFVLVDPSSGQQVGRVTDEVAVQRRALLTSAFGSRLGVAARGSGDVVAFAPSGGDVVWSATTPPASSTTFVHSDETNELIDVFMYDGGGTAETNGTVHAFDEAEALRWSQDVSYMCGVMDGKVVVTVNFQLAVLDGRTGEQLSFDPSMENCPQLLGGGLALVGRSVQAIF